MAYVVIYDACVLHDSALRDLLVRLATKRQLNLRAQWSEDILDEMVRSILERRPDLDPARLARTKELMIESVPDCLVTGYKPLIESLVLPDPKDRHVLLRTPRLGRRNGADPSCSVRIRVRSSDCSFSSGPGQGRLLNFLDSYTSGRVIGGKPIRTVRIPALSQGQPDGKGEGVGEMGGRRATPVKAVQPRCLGDGRSRPGADRDRLVGHRIQAHWQRQAWHTRSASRTGAVTTFWVESLAQQLARTREREARRPPGQTARRGVRHERAHQCSLSCSGCWQLVFHQGTSGNPSSLRRARPPSAPISPRPGPEEGRRVDQVVATESVIEMKSDPDIASSPAFASGCAWWREARTSRPAARAAAASRAALTVKAVV